MIKRLWTIILLIPILLAGCVGPSTNFTLRIVPPRNELPIAGTWKIVSLIQEDSTLPEYTQQWIGKSLYFTNNKIILGDYLLPRPDYRIKRVATPSYLRSSTATQAGRLFKKPDTSILTLSDNHHFYCEIALADEKQAVLTLFNHSFLIRKITNTVDDSVFLSADVSDITAINSPRETEKRSGILLGLRSKDNRYRTLWLAAQNKQIEPLQQTPKIIYPRRSGFYELHIYESWYEQHKEDILFSFPLGDEKEFPEDPDTDMEENRSVMRSVDYIGNDYVSVEETVTLPSQNKPVKSTLKILSVDSLPAVKAVKISDLIGQTAANTVASPEMLQKGLNGAALNPPEEENIGLARSKGYWTFRGRTNRQADYQVGIIPPSHVVFYNELSIPWPRVKNHVPQAVDVLTSPNKDIALILTETEILVYSMLQQNQLGTLLQKIALQEGEKIIMSEWAVGHYVETWTMTFQSHF